MTSPIPNRFRQRILARERQIGLWMSLTSHITAEVASLANFDWMLFDGEHSPNDIPLFVQQLHGQAPLIAGRQLTACIAAAPLRWRS